MIQSALSNVKLALLRRKLITNRASMIPRMSGILNAKINFHLDVFWGASIKEQNATSLGTIQAL